MDWQLEAFLGVNALSAIAFAAVGALLTLKPERRSLGAFLLTWGALVAITNTAAATRDLTTATVLFWSRVVLLPLQAVFLLRHARTHAPRLARITTWTVLALAALGLVVAAVDSSQLLSTQSTSSVSSLKIGAWSFLLYDGPNLLAVALALAALAWRLPAMHPDWPFTLGLCFAYGFSLGYTLAGTQDARLILFAAAFLIGAGIAPWGLAENTPPGLWRAALPILVPLAGLLAFLTARSLPYVLGPGVARFSALPLLLPAVAGIRPRLAPGPVAFLGLLAAAIITAASRYAPANLAWQACAVLCASVAFLEIAWLARPSKPAPQGAPIERPEEPLGHT